MLQYIHYPDPNDPGMVDHLRSLKNCPGICFFMDINKSTDLKYQGGLADWGRKLNNTFNYLIYANHFEPYVVKGIGDEIMLFIPDSDAAGGEKASPFSILEDIYSALFLIRNHPTPDIFLNCKVAIHYCTEVYNITFFKGANDYYGSDIDLTARLMTKAKENRIVLSERYYLKVVGEIKERSFPADSGCLPLVSGPFEEFFRGVPVSTTYRCIDV